MQTMGFNGVLHEAGTCWQLLGNGRRAYNPVLMRFHSPDRLSPFGRGGINAYAYCANDPINLADPSGRFALPLLMLGLGAVAGGASAIAASSSSEQGAEDNTLAWIVGGVIAAASLVAVAGTLGKTSWAKLAAKPRVPEQTSRPPSSSAVPVASSSAQSDLPSGNSPLPPRIAFVDKNGERNVFMSDLDKVVRERVIEVRQFGSRGLTPDKNRVPLGKRFLNEERKLPHEDFHNFYQRFPILWQTGHGYEGWRLVFGGRGSSYRNVHLTWTHDDDFVKIADWGTYRV